MSGLAQKGAKVVIADVSDERGGALAREVGPGSLYVSTDCMDEDVIAKAVKAVAATVAEGLEIAYAEGPFDVAIVDLMLPDGTAPMWCARSRRPTPRRWWPC